MNSWTFQQPCSHGCNIFLHRFCHMFHEFSSCVWDGKRFFPKNLLIASDGFTKLARREFITSCLGLAWLKFLHLCHGAPVVQAAKEGRIKPNPLYNVATWRELSSSDFDIRLLHVWTFWTLLDLFLLLVALVSLAHVTERSGMYPSLLADVAVCFILLQSWAGSSSKVAHRRFIEGLKASRWSRDSPRSSRKCIVRLLKFFSVRWVYWSPSSTKSKTCCALWSSFFYPPRTCILNLHLCPDFSISPRVSRCILARAVLLQTAWTWFVGISTCSVRNSKNSILAYLGCTQPLEALVASWWVWLVKSLNRYTK